MTLNSLFSRIAATAMLGAILVSATAAQRVRIVGSATGKVLPKSETRGAATDEQSIYELINAERRRRGAGPLVWDEKVAQMARNYSRQMARESFFDHFDPDGLSVVDRARRAGLKGWSMIGENLFFAEGYGRIDRLAVRGWMESPSHRRNLLERQYTTTGIGLAQTRDGRIYITQVFLRN